LAIWHAQILTMLCGWFVSAVAFLFITVCFGKPRKHPLPKARLKDALAGDVLELKCFHSSSYKKSDKIKWKFTSYGRLTSVTRFYTQTDDYLRTIVENSASATLLQISPAMVNDSGRFDCIKSTGMCSFKVSVHNPIKMVYVMASRGQKPWGDTIVSHYRVALDWTQWTKCDGCSGNGERRRFGFCYVAWLNYKAHCTDTKDMPISQREDGKRLLWTLVLIIALNTRILS